jgi:hypothetical protein
MEYAGPLAIVLLLVGGVGFADKIPLPLSATTRREAGAMALFSGVILAIAAIGGATH